MTAAAAAPEIRAGGGVVWRRTGAGLELLLIHRPKYDDWSFPKGKADGPEESWRDCAEREVEEETGLRCESGPRVRTVRYLDRQGRAKEVRYYAMEVAEAGPDPFRPNHEVDRIEWLDPDAARRRLTRPDDAAVVDAFLDRVAPR